MKRFEVPEGWVVQAYRFALDPSAAEVRVLESHCGAARFAFNHMLAHVKAVLEQRAAEKSYGIGGDELTGSQGWSMPALRKTWNTRKDVAAPWWSSNSKEAYNTGLDGLARALENWAVSKSGDRRGEKMSFPRFRARHRTVKAVRFTTGVIRVEADRHSITLPRLGRIHTLESTRKLARRLEAGTARILSATVTFASGRWWCAFHTIVENKTRPAHAARRSQYPVVGVDLGVKDLLVIATPDGAEVDRIPAPKSLSHARSGLAVLQRRAARQLGPYDPVAQVRREPSNRWRRTQTRISGAHARVANIRGDAIHKATTMLALQHDKIVIEDLAVKNMTRRSRGVGKRGLNRAIADAALGRIGTQLKYKTMWYGSELVVAPRFYPSTQQCSRCGSKTKIRLAERIYHCQNGCPPIDRDTNAAVNLACLSDTTDRSDGMRTGTGSGPAANHRAGKGRRANHKTIPDTTVTGMAGGDETSTPQPHQTGTATRQRGAA
ncbi:IS607 family element RNA-guided endonuclease TnpB [Mycobacteroides abscessus]|uniref:IS605 family transposase OrfB n=1 Tax=Mycobacteroides abscessus TaxID=36809 RepID=A0A0U0ZSV7_9MYCO|nr:IS607 family element RNA-guided endonuclease TnpB [Mycobacteroides abscessus]CPV66368.1 IS605 family transposase OrfB [Mycobacteroides abscessus]